jgi:drug/metabolite transporter (DMT)-like permease
MVKSPSLRGSLLALASFGCYACCDVSLKALGAAQLHSFQVAFLSALCTLPFVLGQIFWTNRVDMTPAAFRPALPGLTLLRGVITLLGSGFVTYAFTHLPLAECYAIFFTMPLLITLLAWPLLNEPIDARRGVLIVLGFVGVLIALRPGQTHFQLAHLIAACGAVTGAVNSLLLRKIGHRERSGVILLYPLLFQGGVGTFLAYGVWQPMTLQDWAIGFQIGALGSFAGILIIAAYRCSPAIVVAPMQYSQIVWASTLGVIFFNEIPKPATISGISIIIAAGLMMLWVNGRAPALRKSIA